MKTDTHRILIVDDEEALLFGFSKVLQSPEMSVDTAPTAEIAKSLIRKTNYSVVISDLMLSKTNAMEGIEIIHYVKEIQPDSKIIIITAHGEIHTKERVNKLGIDHFFEKPVSPVNLRNVIAKM